MPLKKEKPFSGVLRGARKVFKQGPLQTNAGAANLPLQRHLSYQNSRMVSTRMLLQRKDSSSPLPRLQESVNASRSASEASDSSEPARKRRRLMPAVNLNDTTSPIAHRPAKTAETTSKSKQRRETQTKTAQHTTTTAKAVQSKVSQTKAAGAQSTLADAAQAKALRLAKAREQAKALRKARARQCAKAHELRALLRRDSREYFELRRKRRLEEQRQREKSSEKSDDSLENIALDQIDLKPLEVHDDTHKKRQVRRLRKQYARRVTAAMFKVARARLQQLSHFDETQLSEETLLSRAPIDPALTKPLYWLIAPNRWRRILSGKTTSDEDCSLMDAVDPPPSIVDAYASKGIHRLFPWQAKCLTLEVLHGDRNLVYTAPTSAGKTLVAELVMLRRILMCRAGLFGVKNEPMNITKIRRLEKRPKSRGLVLYVVPLVALAREKAQALSERWKSLDIHVTCLHSDVSTEAVARSVGTEVIVATLEKADALLNKWLFHARLHLSPDDMEHDYSDIQHLLKKPGPDTTAWARKQLARLACVVCDEVHLLGQTRRGATLEILLTKLRLWQPQVQILAMTATLEKSCLAKLASWLDANSYSHEQREVELFVNFLHEETGAITPFNTSKVVSRRKQLRGHKNTPASVVAAILKNEIAAGHGSIVFGATRQFCAQFVLKLTKELLAEECFSRDADFAAELEKRRSLANSMGDLLPEHRRAVLMGVFSHTAALSQDCRAKVEAAFREGVLKVLVATTSLSSGVDLPAHTVILRSHRVGIQTMTGTKFRQMIGRAGRLCAHTEGFVYLMHGERTKKSDWRELEKHEDRLRSALDWCESGYLLDTKRADLSLDVADFDMTACRGFHTLVLTLLALRKVESKQEIFEAAKATFLAHEVAADRLEKLREWMDFTVAVLIRSRHCREIGEGRLQSTNLGEAAFGSAMTAPQSKRFDAALKRCDKTNKGVSVTTRLHRCFVLAPDFDWSRLNNHIYVMRNAVMALDDETVQSLTGVSRVELAALCDRRSLRKNDDSALRRCVADGDKARVSKMREMRRKRRNLRLLISALILRDLCEMERTEVCRKYAFSDESERGVPMSASLLEDFRRDAIVHLFACQAFGQHMQLTVMSQLAAEMNVQLRQGGKTPSSSPPPPLASFLEDHAGLSLPTSLALARLFHVCHITSVEDIKARGKTELNTILRRVDVPSFQRRKWVLAILEAVRQAAQHDDSDNDSDINSQSQRSHSQHSHSQHSQHSRHSQSQNESRDISNSNENANENDGDSDSDASVCDVAEELTSLWQQDQVDHYQSTHRDGTDSMSTSTADLLTVASVTSRWQLD